MTRAGFIAAFTPFLNVIGKALTSEQWTQYGLALADAHPDDVDAAMADLRKTYAFRSVPLPADILSRVDVAKRHRIDTTLPVDKDYKADPSEGEWKTFTIAGLGSVRMHILPDDHPALKRYACLTCKDTGWADGPTTPMGNESVQRCECWKHNPVLQRQRESQATRYVKESTR